MRLPRLNIFGPSAAQIGLAKPSSAQQGKPMSQKIDALRSATENLRGILTSARGQQIHNRARMLQLRKNWVANLSSTRNASVSTTKPPSIASYRAHHCNPGMLASLPAKRRVVPSSGKASGPSAQPDHEKLKNLHNDLKARIASLEEEELNLRLAALNDRAGPNDKIRLDAIKTSQARCKQMITGCIDVGNKKIAAFEKNMVARGRLSPKQTQEFAALRTEVLNLRLTALNLR